MFKGCKFAMQAETNHARAKIRSDAEEQLRLFHKKGENASVGLSDEDYHKAFKTFN